MKYLKLVVAVLLLLCLGDMPYGYYMLVRFVAAIVFAISAYVYYEQQQKALAVIFVVFALLFQPFAKVALGRGLWNVVDVVVAMCLIVLMCKERSKDKV